MSGPLLVDLSHVRGGHATGIERYAIDQFSAAALPGVAVAEVAGGSIARMIAAQQVSIPLKVVTDRPAAAIFAGFPPSPIALGLLGDRAIVFVHDLFAIERVNELNLRARLYSTPQFRFAVARARRFLVNSAYTRDRLSTVCRPDAEIGLYRAVIGDRFGLHDRVAPAFDASRPLRLVTVGTVEPRKNHPGAIAIVRALIARGVQARLDVVGRLGWGDHGFVEAAKDVATFHGFLPEADGRRIIADADLYLCASHDEGLGLPLLEVQHGGLPVIAPNRPPFDETMRAGALLVDTADPAAAAAAIAALVAQPGRLAALAIEARANVAAWNADAAGDRTAFRALLDRMGVSRR